MAKFTVYAAVTCSAFTIVEAETAEDALKIANDRGVVIGGLGSGADAEETFVMEDADGEPENLHVDQ